MGKGSHITDRSIPTQNRSIPALTDPFQRQTAPFSR